MRGAPAYGLAALALVACTPDQADDTVPMTYAEAATQLDVLSPRTRSNWPAYRSPPGNVRAEDFQALFGDTVMISRMFDPDNANFDELKIIFIGADGRYVWCSVYANGRFWRNDPWRAEIYSTRAGFAPLLNPNTEVGVLPGLSPLYDGATGEIVWYTFHMDRWWDWFHMDRWWDWNRGHLQARLPAVTWDLCPGFPSAAELGVEVNAAQTATTYDALLAQDPGTRILRPDLVTPNAIATYNE